MMNTNSKHANNSGNNTKPEVLCGTAFLEVQNVLEFLVMLINQWNKVVDEVRNVWAWSVSPSNIDKLIFKL